MLRLYFHTKFRVSTDVTQFGPALSFPVLGHEAVLQLGEILKSPPYKIHLILGLRAKVMRWLGKDRNNYLEPFFLHLSWGSRIEEASRLCHSTPFLLSSDSFLTRKGWVCRQAIAWRWICSQQKPANPQSRRTMSHRDLANHFLPKWPIDPELGEMICMQSDNSPPQNSSALLAAWISPRRSSLSKFREAAPRLSKGRSSPTTLLPSVSLPRTE